MSGHEYLHLCVAASDHVPVDKCTWHLRNDGEWISWVRTVEFLEQDEDWAFALALVRMKEGVG